MHGARPSRVSRVLRLAVSTNGSDRLDGPRNIFGTPPGTDAFRAGGLIPPSGQIDEATGKEVHRLLTKLEARVTRGVVWEKHIRAQTAEERSLLERLGVTLPGLDARNQASPWKINDNPFLPSGYTYLLQLAAHDLVDSVRSATTVVSSNDAKPNFELASLVPNARLRPLMLDTVYGAGPFEDPLPYETDGSSPTEPRSLLRTFGLKKPSGRRTAGALQYCPFADIMRGSRPVPPASRDVYRQPASTSSNRSEAFVADPRNDDHAIISQLLVVFHLLHNAVIGKLPFPADVSREDAANRRFLCARLVIALIYRHILKQDVLSRVLDPDVYEAYMTHRKRLPLDKSEGLPIEFTAGAFRFGHAMVREQYRTNGFVPSTESGDGGPGFLNFSGARKLSSIRDGVLNGLPNFNWVIDWALFFGPSAAVNLSHRLGPHYASGLVMEPPKGQPIMGGFLKDAGLGARDFLSSAYAGMWSVPKLIDVINARLQNAGLTSLQLVPYEDWKKSMTVWLKDYADGRGESYQLDADDIKRIADDPPLPFFVMFEAAHELDAAGRPRIAEAVTPGKPVFPGRGGRHLGRLGSILVADTMFSALHRQYFGFDEFEHSSPHEGIRRICAAAVSQPDALDGLFRDSKGAERPLDRMEDLLSILQSAGTFQEP